MPKPDQSNQPGQGAQANQRQSRVGHAFVIIRKKTLVPPGEPTTTLNTSNYTFSVVKNMLIIVVKHNVKAPPNIKSSKLRGNTVMHHNIKLFSSVTALFQITKVFVIHMRTCRKFET